MALLTVCVALAVLPGLSAGAGGTGVESEIAQIKSDMSDMKDGLNTIMQTLAAMHKPDGDAGAGSKPRPTPHRRAGAKGTPVGCASRNLCGVAQGSRPWCPCRQRQLC